MKWRKHRTKDYVGDETAIFVREDTLTADVGHGLVVTANRDGQYYVAPADKTFAAVGARHGPFETFAEACTAADTMIGLNAVPKEWSGR
jgi:hypothetical protein